METIRLMKPEDYDAVYALWMECHGMGLNNLDDTREGIEAFLKRNPDTCFVAEENNVIIGVILVGTDGRRAYVYHTAVHPGYRGKGIATRMVDAVIEAVRNIGIHKMALVVFAENEIGNAFWEEKGFYRRHDIYYRDFTIDSEMVKFNT